jgi:hypothetical protein
MIIDIETGAALPGSPRCFLVSACLLLAQAQQFSENLEGKSKSAHLVC